MPRLMNRAEAYRIASQWGSLVRAGDPGACFYGFPVDHFGRGDGRPADERHRAACLAYCGQLIRDVAAAILDGTAKANGWSKADLRRLRSLWRFFRHSETREAARARLDAP